MREITKGAAPSPATRPTRANGYCQAIRRFPAQEPASSPGFVDDYTYAENIAGLTLRIDNLRSAVQQLGPYAANMSQGTGSQLGNGATYKMSVATFDTDWTTSPCTNTNPAAPLHFISGGSTLSAAGYEHGLDSRGEHPNAVDVQ